MKNTRLFLTLLLTACSSRPAVLIPTGAENARITLETRGNGFLLTATAGLIKLVNRKENRVVYHAAPEMIFTPSGQVASAEDNSLTLEPTLVVSSPQKSTLKVCADGTLTIREENGKQAILGKLLLTWFPHPDKLKSDDKGFLTATPESGEPQTLSPQGAGQCL